MGQRFRCKVGFHRFQYFTATSYEVYRYRRCWFCGKREFLGCS